jgi:hypothetical protein
MARPSDQVKASSAVHSEWSVGLESGKMIGRSVLADMLLITSSVNVRAAPDRPKRIVGLTCENQLLLLLLLLLLLIYL